MATPARIPLTAFSLRVIGNVKAELARRDLDGIDLVEPLQLGRNAVYERLRGEKPFKIDELERIADFMGVDVDVLTAPSEIGQAA